MQASALTNPFSWQWELCHLLMSVLKNKTKSLYPVISFTMYLVNTEWSLSMVNPFRSIEVTKLYILILNVLLWQFSLKKNESCCIKQMALVSSVYGPLIHFRWLIINFYCIGGCTELPILAEIFLKWCIGGPSQSHHHPMFLVLLFHIFLGHNIVFVHYSTL